MRKIAALLGTLRVAGYATSEPVTQPTPEARKPGKIMVCRLSGFTSN